MIDKRYNGKHKCYITLTDGERFCPKCDGVGFVKGAKKFTVLTCARCLGDGKIDWIEEATGKRRRSLYNLEA